MNHRLQHHSKHIAFAAGVVLVVALLLWTQRQPKRDDPATGKPPVTRYAGLDLIDPEASYLVLRYVVDTGGNERTREQAIAWLDKQVRHHTPLKAEQETWLLATLGTHGHTTWDPEYRFWIFNSAFNVLHMGRQQEAFTRLLQKLLREAPEKTMRLYALQHLALQRAGGRLTGPLADEIRTDLHTFAREPKSPVAGSTLSTLITWEGPETPTDPQLAALALQLASDPACEVDIRVTALHAARAHALESARRLAVDETQPVLLRKAAIALIGQHGQQEDRVALEALRGENFRLAQAAEPALRAIQQRMTHPQAAEPIPF